MTHSILIVDDERNILTALGRLFRKEPYRILTADNAEEALLILKQGEQPKVIISDQRMPKIDGAEFLALVKDILPDTIRIMLTGFSDINAAMEAINKGGIYRYILKPWNDQELKITVKRAIERYDLVQQNMGLTQELKQKNITLENLNQNLEQMVKERTSELEKALDKNLVLNEQLQQKVKELKGRDRILQYLLTIHPLEEALQTILEVIIDLLRLDSASIYLADEENSLYCAAAINPREDGYNDNDTKFKELREMAFEQDTPVTHDDDSIPFLSVPIDKGQSILGVIEARRKTGKQGFSSSDINKIVNFTHHAAIAISDSQMQESLPSLETTLDDVLEEL
jgi:FixJ family two-component response regulator